MAGIVANQVPILSHNNCIAVDLREHVILQDIFGTAVGEEAGVEQYQPVDEWADEINIVSD